MTSQGVDGTVDKAGRILPDSNQRVNRFKRKVVLVSKLDLLITLASPILKRLKFITQG